MKTGSLTIGQATIDIDNKIYKTIPVKSYMFQNLLATNKNPNDASYVVNENLHLVAESLK